MTDLVGQSWPDGSWEMVTGLPAPALRGHVRRYCGYRERMAPLARREVANADVTLIVSLGPRIAVDGAIHTSFAAGVTDRPTLTRHDGVQDGIQIDVSPLAAGRLLGVPMRELANQVVDLEALLGRTAADLAERLYEAPGWEARFALLDAVLTDRLSEAAPPRPAVTHAWLRLTESRGAAPIAALAAELGCSRRHLSATFSEHVGLPPKRLARVLRFARVAAGLRERRPLAELAYASGYADQAHLNRDFRELAGVTPTAYEASLLPEGGGVAA
jgi:AraC-like DNA-binding protein